MSASIIYKYSLDAGVTNLHLPVGATPLYVGVQNDAPFLWVQIPYAAIKNPPIQSRRFYAIATGMEFNDEGLSYVGTAQFQEMVFHFFEGG